MTRFHKTVLAAVLGGLGWLAGGTPPARADILLEFTGKTAVSGGFRFDYKASLTGLGVYLHSGDYFTLYDFKGLVDLSNSQPADYLFTSGVTGTTPSGVSSAFINDDPTQPNLTWIYTGADTSPVDGTVDLGTFSAVSTLASIEVGPYAAQNHKDVKGKKSTQFNANNTIIPGEDGGDEGGTEPAPEPSALALVGIGFPLLGAFSPGGAAGPKR